MTENSAFLSIHQLTKTFDSVTAVDRISLDVGKGEIFALLGSSGCGKSTLLRMLAGLETPTSGTISLGGKNIAEFPPYQRPINMMFQSYALFPHLNVWDNIAFGLRRDHLPAAEIKQRVAHMLELVQLTPYAKRKPHQLSGGQQQRVALARSLAKRPQLILLDEPLGALDKKLRARTQLELVSILESVGVTCVMVTHDQEEAMTMASRIAVMHEGSILQIGKPSDIYETPNCRFVADFIGNVNMFDGIVVEDEADHVVIDTPECRHYVGHGITGTPGMKASVALRPEKMRLSSHKPEQSYNWVEGVVDDLAYLGSYTIYHVRLKSGARIKVSEANAKRLPDMHFSWDNQVYVSWHPDAIVVLTQ